MISEGSTAPDFTLPRDGGATITLSALRPGKVVLYFYPKDDTPGCTLEAQDFNARLADFTAAGASVIGVSKDSVKSHDKFCRKHGLSIILASDEGGTACEDYGVWVEKSMYGKTYMGIERTTVLIDGEGKVARVWPKVSVKGHADEVLAAVKALLGVSTVDKRWTSNEINMLLADVQKDLTCFRRLSRPGMSPESDAGKAGTMGETTLAGMAVEVLATADGRAKTALCRRHAASWFAARTAASPLPIGRAKADAASRPPGAARTPGAKGRAPPPSGSLAGRIALLHAVAHIELNAVDLHWDIIARFTDQPMPPGFYDDWVKAADEEAKHFNLIADCLEAMGSHYGALLAHAGMWRAAEDTADDLLGRLAVVPMVLEARGLDVTPGMIDIFAKAGETQAVAALEIIYAEEVAHVAYGSKWFNWLCGRDGSDPKEVFHALVRRYFHANLKPPFNEAKRADAGLPPDFYWPLAEQAG